MAIPPDTDGATYQRYLALLRGLPLGERFARALALTSLARAFAWQGARRRVGHLGEDAVLERFLVQLYGPDFARRAIALRRSQGVP
jgi:hypothetical protein